MNIRIENERCLKTHLANKGQLEYEKAIHDVVEDRSFNMYSEPPKQHLENNNQMITNFEKAILTN